jgi:two-component system sensor histidine kinase KdpD
MASSISSRRSRTRPRSRSSAGAATTLLADAPVDDGMRRELLLGIQEEAERLKRLVQTLLEMTRLESRALRLRREWHAVEEVVGAALRNCAGALTGRRRTVRVPPDLP